MIGITPLDAWIKEKARISRDLTGVSLLEAIKAYQLRRLNGVIEYARRNAPFYRQHLRHLPDLLLYALSDMAKIPFTYPSDISGDPFRFLTVLQDDVAHIVTLRTSGSTGDAKRIFFTEEDLELTIDFFHHGMSTLVLPGQRVVILLPGERPDSVGDLLARGLQRMDVATLVYGPVRDPRHAAEAIAAFGADCLVGIPTQVLDVACSQPGVAMGKGPIKGVLLSTDYVPRSITERLEDIWGCRVFNHYGMTEMGLGGGVECEALHGYHLREADLYFEVVDHETGAPCPDGVTGEVVFTTITRVGMPLIRYRTGDIARIIPEPCPCGSVLRRMDRVRGRWDGAVSLGSDCTLTISEMDEALFRIHGLLDYRASVSTDSRGRFGLHIDIHRQEDIRITQNEVIQTLRSIDAIGKALASSDLDTPTVRFSAEGRWKTTGMAKRKIVVI